GQTPAGGGSPAGRRARPGRVRARPHARGDQHPIETAGRKDGRPAGPNPAGSRLLQRLRLRRVAAGRVAARDARIQTRDRLRPGPKTCRPSVTIQELLKSMRDNNIQTNSLVTTLEGRLVGVISRADAEATLVHEQSGEGSP